MTRRASDNEYLHRDFHGALSAGIEYLHDKYGEQAVRDYLRRFAGTFYSPLKRDLKDRGLIALKEHFEKIYSIEDGRISIVCSDDEMIMEIDSCPRLRCKTISTNLLW